jgi:ribosomal protein S18 acetylase RimI-like enzyme
MIFYTDSIANVTAENLSGFFGGWLNPPSPAIHLKLLAGSDEVVLAVDDETGNVVGFITAISDGVLSAHVPLLEVLPAYRGRGIGSELVRRMLDKLSGLYAVDLICDPDLQPFYTRLGMKAVGGMMVRDYGRQSGG